MHLWKRVSPYYSRHLQFRRLAYAYVASYFWKSVYLRRWAALVCSWGLPFQKLIDSSDVCWPGQLWNSRCVKLWNYLKVCNYEHWQISFGSVRLYFSGTNRLCKVSMVCNSGVAHIMGIVTSAVLWAWAPSWYDSQTVIRCVSHWTGKAHPRFYVIIIDCVGGLLTILDSCHVLDPRNSARITHWKHSMTRSRPTPTQRLHPRVVCPSNHSTWSDAIG